MEAQNEELLKRIAKLVRENKELSNRLKTLSDKHEKLAKKNEQNEALIQNLPKKLIPKEFKKPGKETMRFQMATVLFADIQGFSKLSEHEDKQSLIDELDQIFYEFDNIVEKYNIEKVKTIGDTYMAAGGIPVKNRTNPIEVVMAALEMQSFLNAFQEGKKQIWDIRIGIHTGPVTATSGGKRRISYDIKGDTVNIASRMQASCEPGKINISVMTYELTKEFFNFEYYGKMPVKYKGDLEMYYVKHIKEELTKASDLEPNQNFQTKFGLIQFGDIQEIILDKLERELPDYLYYHNVKHTIDVVTQAELIGWGEGVSDEEILLLKTSALFHDAGHTISFDNHEFFGTQIARDILPKYKYTEKQIDRICEIIMATKLPPKPKNLLEKIMCDSDLDYLGRIDFIPVSNTLYKELKAQNKIGSLNDWNKLQVKFLSNHQFFTQTAMSLREVNKQKQIDRIKSLIVDDEEEAAKLEANFETTDNSVD